MADKNLFGHIGSALSAAGKGVRKVRQSELVDFIARLDPDFRAMQAQQKARREAQAWDLKKLELQAEIREKTEKKRIQTQEDARIREEDREKKKQADAKSDIAEFLEARTESTPFMQLGVPTTPGLPLPMQPPQMAVAPGASQADLLPDFYGAAETLGIPASEVAVMREQKFSLPPTAEKPGTTEKKVAAFKKTRAFKNKSPAEQDAAIEKMYVSGGVNVTQKVYTGEVAKTTKAKLETKIVEAEESLIAIDQMMEKYDPMFNEFIFQVGAKASN